MHRETLAAIDIGSNAVRLLINYVEVNETTEFKKAAFIRVPIRLGEDVFSQGEIGKEKIDKLTGAMISFSYLMKTYNVKRYRACATSAMRDAKNGVNVCKQIKETSGIDIEIISGQEEAQTIFETGGTLGIMGSKKTYLFVDVGGGSVEITVYAKGEKICAESFALGTVRTIAGAVDELELLRFKTWLKENAFPLRPIAIVGSGGNINKVHKMLMKQPNEPSKYREIKELYSEMKKMTYEQRINKLGLNSYRADVIMPAMNIFLTVCKTCKIEDIIVPKFGLADGIIHKLHRDN